ncbi:MAG: 2-oxoglutarate and iron-dependent oxygenase domain-containing protein [Myxococcota bacterium]
MKQTIPVVSLEDYAQADKRDAFIKALGESLEALGFVAVEDHGIPGALFERTYGAYREFFAQPDDAKKKAERAETGRRRGYTSFGVEHAKDSKKPDLKEFYHVGRELDAADPMAKRLPENVWPGEPAAVRDVSLEVFAELDRVADAILSAFGEYLGEGPEFFPQMVAQGNTILRVIHYPVCDGFDEPGVMRAAAHEDINLMTLLAPADESGLELLTREGEWLPIAAVPGQIIVDTGDMMSRITNDRIPATTHRVVNPKGDPKPRYSMPFFIHPHLDVDLTVLESCVPAGESAKYPPINNEEFLLERLRAIGLKS